SCLFLAQYYAQLKLAIRKKMRRMQRSSFMNNLLHAS
ncbi:MAG: hypothetical protein RLZZ384_1401, partial [Pseudomonadota bacterium]